MDKKVAEVKAKLEDYKKEYPNHEAEKVRAIEEEKRKKAEENKRKQEEKKALQLR